MVATLAPGQWYLARRQEGLWTEVEHEGVVGWVATDQIRRSATA